MIKSIVGAARELGKNPILLLPALVAVAIVLGLIYLFVDFALDMVLNVVFLELVPESGLASLPFQFGALYGLQLVAIAVLGIISAVVFSSLSFFYAAYVRSSGRRKGAYAKATGSTVGGLGKVFGFTIFLVIISLFFAALLWAFVLLWQEIEILGIILIALLVLAGFYLYIKLAFVLQALALEKGTVKQALQQSWEFCQKRFWHVVLFLVVIAAINQAIMLVGSFLSDLILEEPLSLAVLAIFWAVSLAFTGLAMALYYQEKKLGK
jgi:hypothetical protein